MGTVRHVLLDADDVLQHLPGGWHAALEVYAGKRTADGKLSVVAPAADFQRAWTGSPTRR